MTRKAGLYSLLVCLSIFAFKSAQAQEQAQPAQPDGQVQAENEFVPSSSPSVSVTAKHGDWQIVCSNTDKSDCIMVQVAGNEKGEPVVEFRLQRLEDQKDKDGKLVPALIQIIAPLSVHLPAGITLKIDDGKGVRLPFIQCLPVGCIVRTTIPNEILANFKKGKVANLLVIPSPGAELSAPMSLKGFTAAYNAL